MGRIIVSQNVSLDGVGQDPTGEGGFARGGWFNEIGDADKAAWARLGEEEALGAAAFLLGRRTYEYLAARWPERTGTWADRLNGMPKYVVSSTLESPEWNNSTVLEGEVLAEVTRLRREVDGEIVVAASHELVRTLLEHDLVDELRMVVFPVVLGDGDRLLGRTAEKLPLRLLGARGIGENLALLSYERVR